MLARELRQKYLEFFESKGALRLPSDSLVTDDPTLLFTVAGMVPFKAYFEDRATPPRTSIATSQKCLRTVDIDDIGDISHCTFFEMLGNFSFGDYFKKEAIEWAWEFLFDVLQLDLKNIRVTVYKDDDEAYELWQSVGMPPERISRLGQDKNYWPANAIVTRSQGPCGPCSEIFFDLEPDKPFDADWKGDGYRWLEIWNLVFTQFTGRGEGDDFQLIPLPKKNIDTGMGLDRTAAVINRLAGPFETDLLRPVIAKLEELSGKTYTSTPDSTLDIAFRRIADHTRSTAFLLADGVIPDKAGRGYVLRRLMRRAIVAGIRTLGFGDRPFLDLAIPQVVETMGDQYPELAERQEYILGQVRQEETRFRETLQRGLVRLDEALAQGTLTGEEAFNLYQTNGLPYEVTREVAAERGIEIDREGYDRAEAEHRDVSRSGEAVTWDLAADDLKALLRSVPQTKFVGYGYTETVGHVVGLIVDGKPVSSVSAGQSVEVILNESPFYAESGGQVGDTGTIASMNGSVTVLDTKKQNGIWFHRATVASGTLSLDEIITASVDVGRRQHIMQNHTATHLLHKALRSRLGTHVHQRGSLVAPDKLRFDFSHGQSISPEDLSVIEDEVNTAIQNGLPVEIVERSIDEARQMGAMMLFGEKYGDIVRVVSVGGDYSREFCGGTHVHNAKDIGLFRLVSEKSAAAGVRRIEAVTGNEASQFDEATAENRRQAVEAGRLEGERKAQQAEQAKLQQAKAGEQAEILLASAETVGDLKVIVASPEGIEDAQTLSNLADDVLNRVGSGVLVLGASGNGKVFFVAKVSKDAVAKGAHAGNLVKAAAQVAGGGGGGRPDFAQAGGKDVSKLADALNTARTTLTAQLG